MPIFQAPPLTWNPSERIESLLAQSGVVIHHDRRDGAAYNPTTDEIHLPPRENFNDSASYYNVLLHELGAALTEAQGYAQEELRVEIASWLLLCQIIYPEVRAVFLGCSKPGETRRRRTDALASEDAGRSPAGRELDLDDRRSILAGTLAEALLAHQKMIELKLLAPESRFARQELAESIKGIETVAKVNRNLKQKAVPNLPPNLSAPEEFAEVLRESGFILEGTPVLDGAIHRVRGEGGHGSSKDGAYCGYLNGGKGPPAGWYVNHKDGGEVKKWVGTGQALSSEQKAVLRAEVAETQAQLKEEKLATHKRACAEIMNKIEQKEWTPATDEHPFLKAKGVPNYGLLKNEKNNLLAVGIDLDKSIFGRVEGDGLAPPTKRSEMVLRKTIQVAQIISPSGYKQFKKNCIAKGAMFLIGEEQFKDVAFEQIRPDHLLDDRGKPPPEILVAEGYSTGATLHRATNLPVAVAFNAGNLKPVAEALRRKFPTATLTICADNDHQIKTNVGIEKAAEAAKIVGGQLIFPDFTSAEKQQKLTDFNDLAQSRGLVAVTEFMRQKRQTAQNNIPQMGR